MFPKYAQEKLELFDKDGDRSIDIDEILAGCDALLRERERSKYLKYFIAGLFLLIVLLLVAIGVMMFLIVDASKDTGMMGTTLTVKGSNLTVSDQSFYTAPRV